MGGRSKSTKRTANNQTSNNYVNKGKFAGAGKVSIDESDHGIKDSYNSIDKSDHSTRESFNTDNSIEVDDGNFAGGDIVLSDSGAISAAKEIAISSIKESVELSKHAVESNERVNSRALESTERTTARALHTAEFAIDEVQDIASRSVSEVGSVSKDVIRELTSSSKSFADNLKSATQANFSSSEKVLQNIAKQSTNDKSIIAELARNTSLSGQDIVAKSSEKMTMYMAVAVGFGFLAMALIVARK